MNGYVIVNTSSGAHVVSQAFVKRFGMKGGPECDAETHAHAIAGMLFGLLANASEAMGTRENIALDSLATENVDPAEMLLRALETAKISLGHPTSDSSPNAAQVVLANIGAVELHIFQHGVFPLACVVIVPHLNADTNGIEVTLSRESLGALMAESIVKAFSHSLGMDYIDAASKGIAKPFRKAFSPHLARCLNQVLAKCLAALSGISPTTLRILPREGLFLCLTGLLPEAGRWLVHGVVTNGGAEWSCSFGACESVAPPELHAIIAAFDSLIADLENDIDESTLEMKQVVAVKRNENVRVEVQEDGSGNGFSAMMVPGADCIALSSNRLAQLETAMTCAVGTASQMLLVARSIVHALAKLRVGADTIVSIVDLDVDAL